MHAVCVCNMHLTCSDLQTHRPVSAAVQTHQGLGTYQRSRYKDLVAEAVQQINSDRKKNGMCCAQRHARTHARTHAI